MLVLALDTTTRAGSAAVVRGDAVLALAEGNPARTHGERLPAELEAVLSAAGLRLGDVELLAVARGPGAFTGLRIGLAAMQGVAMVTGCPVVGVSALDALAVAGFDALGVDGTRVGAWMDAARGEVFAAAYDLEATSAGLPALVSVSEPEVGTPEAVWSVWQASGVAPPVLVGDGAVRYGGHLTNTRVLPPPLLAPTIARLAIRLLGTRRPTPHELEPLYVRRPDAERGTST